MMIVARILLFAHNEVDVLIFVTLKVLVEP